tara:strand:+ start:141 stop:767 length:627 start_codon:yes stop_codon:yes gene_type:complete
MKVEQIIFDFDGVIVDSHKVKDRAFYELFFKYGSKIAKKTQSYHLKNIGKSRFFKFNYILKEILKQKSSKKKLKILSNQFNKITIKKIIKLKTVPHLLTFLKNNNDLIFHISTGTPQDIIIKILKKKKLYSYFEKICGSPSLKINHIKKIKKNRKKTLFVGDSYEDYLSCKKTKTPFILREHNENKKIFKNKKILKIKNFKNFEKFIK